MEATLKDKITGPAIIRRRYMGGWEYALLNKDGTFAPFGARCPSGVLWVYQVTWKDKLQGVARIGEDQWVSKETEQRCWWTNARGSEKLHAVTEHWSKPRKVKLV